MKVKSGLLLDMKRRIVEGLGGTLLGDMSLSRQEDRGWRPLTSRARGDKDAPGMLRDLDILSHDLTVKVALKLYAEQPLARWLVDMPVTLCVGSDVAYSVTVNAKKAALDPAKARELQDEIRKALDPFWYHATHNISERAHEYGKTLLVTGHVVLPIATINPVSGTPQFDVIDAGQICGVDAVTQTSMVPGFVRFRPVSEVGSEEKGYLIVSPNEDGLLIPTDQPTEGEPREKRGGVDVLGSCLYFRYNNLLNSMMGQSYLLDVADWIDALGEFSWSALDRAKLRNNIVWHLKATGLTDEAIKKKVDELMGSLGKPGSVFGSNENVSLEAVAAKLEAGDSVELGRMLLTFVLGAKGFPESWYSQGGNANRATAGEQTDVAYKSLAGLQSRFRTMFRRMLWLAYDLAQSKQPKILTKRSDATWLSIEPELPQIQERDMSRLAASASQLASGLGTAIEDQLISLKTARSIYITLVANKALGGGYAVDEEEAEIEAAAAAKEERSAEMQAQFARKRIAPELNDKNGKAPGVPTDTAVAVGDRVTVKPGKEHMPEHKGKQGTVKIANGKAVGILFDGDMKIHKWYSPEELVVLDTSSPSKPEAA